MHRLLLILLVLLLPLRVWAAQDMAVKMAGQEVAAAAVQGVGTQTAGASAMPADCPMMLAKAASDGSHGGGHPLGCQTCQLCMALASMPVPPAQAAAVFSQAPPLLGATRFASAELARLAEPPIR